MWMTGKGIREKHITPYGTCVATNNVSMFVFVCICLQSTEKGLHEDVGYYDVTVALQPTELIALTFINI